jgi:hypothetical protein
MSDDLNDVERRRRMVLLCCNFMRNLAFHRAGIDPKVKDDLLNCHNSQGEFWIQAHGNFLDTCALDWCKLFTDSDSQHHWHRVFDDRKRFKKDLYTTLGVRGSEFDDQSEKVRIYRNKFVGHLDQERMMILPTLDLAKKAIAFLHARLVQQAPDPKVWEGLPSTAEQLDGVFTRASEAAQSVYGEALRWTAKWERDPTRN